MTPLLRLNQTAEDNRLSEKLYNLRQNLSNIGSALIAFSGGVDSSLLVQVAFDVLGDRCLAVIATSETYPKAELEEAEQLAQKIGVNYLVIATEELKNEEFASNPVKRCYFCKTELYNKLKSIAKEKGYQNILDGANLDDALDYRPGRLAGKEIGVRSPLEEAGLAKAEVRQLAKELGLSNWDKPSSACLSSRLPYGQRITIESLNQVELAENILKQHNFRQVRVRHHQNIARVEIPKEDFARLTGSVLDDVVAKLKKLGFSYITLDLQGLRSGSMNEVLEKN
ncbi:MAG TPA: ATP-dependent sacrificial sulfur transferase LarE [Desulfosporosinus sp.]|nr:ATP-dependent sacrificial sulfur transferase LarE [Desulfosporosinus sp.]